MNSNNRRNPTNVSGTEISMIDDDFRALRRAPAGPLRDEEDDEDP